MRKVDNSNMAAKLSLRRYGLDKYRGGGASADVFDCCQGSGEIWKAIKRPIKSYWGVDVKKGNRRITVKAERVVGNVNANTFDIDTYGSPLSIFRTLVQNTKQKDLLVYATSCNPLGSIGNISKESEGLAKVILGEDIASASPRQVVKDFENNYLHMFMVSCLCESWKVEEIFTCESGKKGVQYIGIKLTKGETK